MGERYKTYNLYLDESETFILDKEKNKHIVFGIAGIIIDTDYDNSQLKLDLNNLKNKLWSSNFNDCENFILHEKEVKDISNKFNKKKFNKINNYNEIFKDSKNIKILYAGLEKIIRNGHITTIGACIKINELNALYESNIQNDRYLICLQAIIENFIHFLHKNNGKGHIIYEHNGDSSCKDMRMKFNMIKTMGTMFISPYFIQEKLIDINFPKKTENIPGLQIADFIPNVIIRKISGNKLDKNNIYKAIKKAAYSGNTNNTDIFGIKILPF